MLEKRKIFIAVWLITLMTLNSCGENISLNSPDQLVVIIKADDYGETTANWDRFIKIVSDSGICAGVGIIAKNVVTESTVSEIQRVSCILQANKYPVIEFWNHGYDHSRVNDKYEFDGTDYNYQFGHIQSAQNFFSKTLYFTCRSFGAPFNKTSTETATAINHFPEINVWMCYQKIENQYPNNWKDPNKKVIKATDEHIILDVDYASVYKFKSDEMIKNYKHDKKKPYILIQLHPNVWKKASFDEFEKLIHFYKSGNRAIFMTPFQYYEYLHKLNNVID
jgi:hypothetical protein